VSANSDTREDSTSSGGLALQFPDELVEAISQRVARLVGEHLADVCGLRSPWLDFTAARAYLGFSRDKLYKLTAANAIPFRKKRDGQGLLFHRDELDTWLESHYPRESWPS
jgi:excisionase family DNA binding protein